jgi:Xaa-Pro aminopeptidase
MRFLTRCSVIIACAAATIADAQSIQTRRPFGTLREQAEIQQRWLQQRMDSVLPAIMRKHGVEMWVVPMREYNEDPTFTSLVSPTTFAARRRTIYVFVDTCGKRGEKGVGQEGKVRETEQRRGEAETDVSPVPHPTSPTFPPSRSPSPLACALERIALGGTSQGGIYQALRSNLPAAGPAGGRAEQRAELWGDEQWQVLKRVIEERQPRTIHVNISRAFAFSDGLSAGEYEGMRDALGPTWSSRFRRNDLLALDLIATRLADEQAAWRRMQEVVWGIIDTAFSNAVITPGVTRTQDVVWWMRQKVNDLGLGSWFQPSVSVQRRGVGDAELGDNPVIQRGDVLHCDFGIVAYRLTTDTQHMGYVLRDGETDVPAGIKRALANSNRLQDIVMSELRAGRTGNEVLRASLARMRAEGIDGTVYSHPIGTHGHGAGPLIGLWDRQAGVPDRGDAKVIPNMWYSIELQATTPVPEWNGQRVRSAQEEDAVVGADGVSRWALRRQTEFWIVR